MQGNPRAFSIEAELPRLRSQIEELWASRVQGRMVAADGVSVAYAIVQPAEMRSARAIVISPGRTEFIDKYSEVAFDFVQQGYRVYVIDHRGQGYSDRLLADTHKGHVGDFEDYVTDLHQLISEVVQPRESLAPVLVGHSMGGAIVARYIQRFTDASGAVMCSPMLEINTGAPQRIVWPILSRIESLLASPGKEPGYVPGGTAYEETLFREDGRLNSLTSSEQRLEYFSQQYRDFPQFQLGSPTRHWLLQAFEAMARILQHCDQITVPVAVLVSGNDRIVREGGVSDFVRALEEVGSVPVSVLRLEGAEHELLMETDAFRLPAMNFMLDFIESIDR